MKGLTAFGAGLPCPKSLHSKGLHLIPLSAKPDNVIDILAGVDPVSFLPRDVIFLRSTSETSRDFPTIDEHSSTFQKCRNDNEDCDKCDFHCNHHHRHFPDEM